MMKLKQNLTKEEAGAVVAGLLIAIVVSIENAKSDLEKLKTEAIDKKADAIEIGKKMVKTIQLATDAEHVLKKGTEMLKLDPLEFLEKSDEYISVFSKIVPENILKKIIKPFAEEDGDLLN